jgi:branched-chain amino acid transport system ATP-binding protein
MGAILRLEGLSKSFGGLRATRDVSFELAEGAIQAVIGPNGAGKTTLFNLIAGSLKPDSGKVLYKGRDISGMPPHKIAGEGILRTFQALKLAPKMSALENVMLGYHALGRSGFMAGMLALPRARRDEKAAREAAMAALERLGIAEAASKAAGSLPFGTQRAVELARALSGKPSLLLLDEPASGLNMRETEELCDRIVAIRAEGTSVLLVEHDMSLVMGISDRVVVLSFGEKVAEGAPREVQRDPEVLRIYLGDEDA